MQLHGIDFTSAPTRRKAITIASGAVDGAELVLHSLLSLHDFSAFAAWLRRPGPWLGAFDFPFSLPRELVEHLGWPCTWPELIRHVAALPRADLRITFKAFCDARPVGNKFAHRATDRYSRSSPSMKWVNPPVAYMLHAGAPMLLDAGLTVAGMHAGDPARIALEAYPGMLARSITRASYKNDDRLRQTPERHAARVEIVEALERGDHPWELRLAPGKWRAALIEDASGDLLDAVLCAVLAGWAWRRRDAQFGLPPFDALEGWTVGSDVSR